MRNKILFSLLFLILFLVIPVSCYSFTFSDVDRNVTITCEELSIPDNRYFFIHYYSTNTYWCIVSDKPFIIGEAVVMRDYFFIYSISGNGSFRIINRLDNYPNGYSSYYNTLPSGMVCSNYDLKDKNGKTLFKKTTIDKSFIENKKQIETGKFDKVVINAADYTNEELYLLTYYYSENTDNPMDSLYPRKEILLRPGKDFFVGAKNEKAIYEVPLSHTSISLKER